MAEGDQQKRTEEMLEFILERLKVIERKAASAVGKSDRIDGGLDHSPHFIEHYLDTISAAHQSGYFADPNTNRRRWERDRWWGVHASDY